jgi:hypothetical protein
VVFISPEIVYLGIVYSVCEIHTLAEVYKSAMKGKLQIIADIFWETKISSNQKSCDFSNIYVLLEAVKKL